MGKLIPGIVNQLGSYSVSLIAKSLNKQVYVFAESFKFVREYPAEEAHGS